MIDLSTLAHPLVIRAIEFFTEEKTVILKNADL